MKRFFQPVQKQEGSSSKKRDVMSGDDGEGAKVASEVKSENGAGIEERGDPTKFLSWNANSFLLRLKNDRNELFELIRNFDPDIIALQEVRMPASGRNGEPKNQCVMKDDTISSRDEKQTILRALSAKPLSGYQAWWSLAGSKYSGTGILVKHCFKPISVRFSIETGVSPATHESDGRVIIAEFKTFRFLNTYVPNNGWKDEDLGFKRRRQWDKQMHQFVSQYSEKPLIWCGDLNVSHEEVDVSEPTFFQNAKQKGYTPPSTEDIGQPGFTVSERKRFSKMLEDGKLVDAYRWLHKEQELDDGFTWSGNPVGKYRGKRMRIDYFLISRELVGRLLHSDICGRGIELQGFCGSDHCPITLELSQDSNGVSKVATPHGTEPSIEPVFEKSAEESKNNDSPLEIVDNHYVSNDVKEVEEIVQRTVVEPEKCQTP